MANNTLSNQQQTSTSLPDVEMDKAFEPYKKSKFKITAQYNDTGNLLKFYGESPGRKTPWDWFQLLIIPVLVVLISAGFGILQVFLSNNLAKQQHDSDQRLAQQQNTVEQNIAHETQQQIILKTYLDDMSNLLLSTSIATPQLLQANKNDAVRKVAQAKTQIVLESLDAKYKADVMTFLYRAGLIAWHNLTPTPIPNTSAFPLVNLDFDNFNGLDLTGFYMTNVDIRDINMNDAQLNNTILTYDNLSISYLMHAHMVNASLHGVDLSGSDLSGAWLNCDSISVNPNVIVMDKSELNVCPNLFNVKFIHAKLIKADLRGDDLSSANLTNANLTGAQLNCNVLQGTSYCVKLRGATLDGADLSGANLKGTDVDPTYLEKVAKSLHGTIMPDGTVHA